MASSRWAAPITITGANFASDETSACRSVSGAGASWHGPAAGVAAADRPRTAAGARSSSKITSGAASRRMRRAASALLTEATRKPAVRPSRLMRAAVHKAAFSLTNRIDCPLIAVKPLLRDGIYFICLRRSPARRSWPKVPLRRQIAGHCRRGPGARGRSVPPRGRAWPNAADRGVRGRPGCRGR